MLNIDIWKCSNDYCNKDCMLITALTPHLCPNFSFKNEDEENMEWKKVIM